MHTGPVVDDPHIAYPPQVSAGSPAHRPASGHPERPRRQSAAEREPDFGNRRRAQFPL
ncbi:hypothetical protein GCM10010345_88830 [Streptomyces canarius]|uniref:Uncharacterized protein n=1 Tax=Streptomyces canarius TaxID=285453 RepID=A0ABQ3DAG0_9ACTN|nr:hypothetical protein GCM10010345_88830 [Streptomyces canarius]